MAGERLKLEVETREAQGSAEARRLRARGMIPGVLYGSGKTAASFAVSERELRRVLTGEHGRHAILDVIVGEAKATHHAVLKDFQLHPVRSRVLHIDLQEVRLDRAIQAQVAVELIGESEGQTMGGILTQIVREVNVEALPMSVPDRIELDISAMQIGDSLRLADLVAPEGVTLLDGEDVVLASVSAPRVEEEPEPTEEELEGLEEGEVPEGEEGEVPEGEGGEPAEGAGDESTEE
jgi:large subunit ribosomal protein L25